MLARIAGFSLVAMVFLTVVNMVLRVVYAPLGATAEIVGWLSAITIAFALGYTQIYRGHVMVTMLVEKFPPRLQKIVEGAGLLVGVLLFAVVTWEMFLYGLRLQQINVLSESLGVAFYPFVHAIALAFAGLTLALLADFCKLIKGVAER